MRIHCLILALFVAGSAAANGEDSLRERLKDENGSRTDVWVYNDISAARQQARKENKPLFVTFRCVPCKACAAFDADVASGNDKVLKLAREKFIPVRQVEMKNVDLSLFEFDHDLNWAAMFINADGVVYARYGTQSAEGPDAYNSIEGLMNTMNRVLELHAAYPGNMDELRGKRGNRSFTSALKMPGMQNAEKLARETQRNNCIHCHMIHDAQHFEAQENGTFTHEMLWRFPLPDNVGLKIDRVSGIRIDEVTAGSAAAAAGLKAGEDILKMNGQRITSIADIQWVLHKLPNDASELEVETRGTRRTLKLPADWKKHDFSWRGSMWSVSPKLRVWAPNLSYDRRKQLGVAEGDEALLVKWINRGSKGGRSAFDSGLRQNDVIVALAGRPIRMSTRDFNVHIKLNYKVGDKLPLTVLRRGKRVEVAILLVE